MRIALVASVGFLPFPCGGSGSSVGDSGVATPDPEAVPAPSAWSQCEPSGQAEAVGAVQDGDELIVDVRHAGGCGFDHRLSICRESLGFLESNPVQTRAYIWHDPAGDTCEALVSESAVFDLVPLFEAFDQAYGAPGQVIVNVDGLQVTVDVPAP
ncbi:MAG: hypothetical protein AAF211_15450 [Myxococcota bacterium]